MNYRDLHLGRNLLLGRREFLKRCKSTRKTVGKAVQQTVDKVQKLADKFPIISRHYSSSSTASSKCSTVLDPDPELINAQNFDFAKPKLFFKNIGKYAATSTYIHICIPFNFTTVFNTRQAIAGVYDQLLEKHEEPFKSITKSVTDISLAIIEGSLEDFRDIIKALPQKTEISTPDRPKQFIALGISIAAMAMSTFNTVRITQLNEEISTLKEKMDLILDVVHLHEKHLHHVEEKLEQTNKLLANLLEANVWFSSKVTDAI